MNDSDDLCSETIDFTSRLEFGSEICFSDNPPRCCLPFIPYSSDVVLTISSVILLTIGGIGNMLTIFAFPYARGKSTDKRSPLHSSVTVLILNLSASDLLYCWTTMSYFLLHHMDNERVVYSKTICWWVGFGAYWTGCVSFHMLVTIAINRCVAICFPLSPLNKIFSFYKGIPVAISVWLGALVLYIPTVFEVNGKFGYKFPIGQCDLVPANGTDPFMLICLLGILLPLVTLVTSSTLIFLKIWNNKLKLAQSSGVSSQTISRLEERRNGLGRLLIVLTLCCFTFISPLFITYFVGDFTPYGAWHTICLILYYNHFTANFFIYVFRNRCYRNAYYLLYFDAKVFLCGVLRSNQRAELSPSVTLSGSQ